MGLREYNEKRDFTLTPEPAGERTETSRHAARTFVTQKHAASHLHYDFRLELEGVLKSWSVPKGPSVDPTVHRLAMETEDHPLDYADFEGVIPKGQYGGGTVIVWDRGTWVPLDDNPHRAYRAGKLRFELHGEKLRGVYALVRKDDRAWLLSKAKDAHASTQDIVAERPESVATGRMIEDVATARDRVWQSNRGAKALPVVDGGRRAARPKHIALAQPKTARAIPAGDEWLHELLLEGDRVLVHLEKGRVRIEHGKEDITSKHRPAVEALETTRLEDAILDGVIAGETLLVFDLLRFEGRDLRAVPLEERKTALEQIVPTDDHLRYVWHAVGNGESYLEKACELGARGVISKRRNAHYGAAGAWMLTACKPEIAITNPDRVMYPDAGLTKMDVARYYEKFAPWILPHLVGRPLTLVHCAKGLPGCTFMKHGRVWGPSALRRVRIQEKTKLGEYLIADDLAGLLALVQMDILEIHTWNATYENLEKPNRIVFDLDPGNEVTWPRIVKAAREVRQRLRDEGLQSWVKTTGGVGLHVVAPLLPSAGWEACADFCRKIAREMERDAPGLFTTSMAKKERTNRIYLDVLRNTRGNTSVAAYSTRARPAATVSMPVTWEALGKAPHVFTIESARVPKADPWEGYFEIDQTLPPITPRTRGSRGAHAAP